MERAILVNRDRPSSLPGYLRQRTAQDYEELVSRGIRHYRADLTNFIDKWRSVPSFDSDMLQASEEFGT